MVLQFLREHKLYANISRSIFDQNKIHYLGHIISAEGIEVDHEKIEVIRGWKMPKNVIEFISFMALSSYYLRFIKGFSKIASPITYLQKKGTNSNGLPSVKNNFNS